MTSAPTFVALERAKAVAWKRSTGTLPDEAREPAPYLRDGTPQTGPLPFCLPPEHAALSLLPEVRTVALGLFAELGVPWHAGIDDGPGNHLLSSQVQYGTAVYDPGGPVRADVLPFPALLDEPIYQLVRQQLLAWEFEKAKVLDVDRVRVVHVMPSDNVAYGESLRDEHRQVGDTVHEVWHALLRRPDRFISLDSAVFADPAVTSQEYVDRYGGKDGSHDQ